MDILTENYENLANTIIIKAVVDYKRALRKNRTEVIEECEKFFRSEYFMTLTKLDPELLISKVKKEISKNDKKKRVYPRVSAKER